MENLTSAVKLAIELEKKGYDLYTKTARESDHPVISSTFLGLAQRELEHIKRIEVLYAEISKETINYQKIQEISVPVDKQTILNLIMDNLKGRLSVKPKTAVSPVYEIALQLEKDSYNYYKKLSGELKDPPLAQFFEILAAEENEHYSIIQESKLYLEHPGDWFNAHERWIVEG